VLHYYRPSVIWHKSQTVPHTVTSEVDGGASYKSSGTLPLLSPRPLVTFPALWLLPNYTAWWQRHVLRYWRWRA